MRTAPVLLIMYAFLMLATPAYSEVYQYFDEEGTLIVTNNPYGTKRPSAHPEIKNRQLYTGLREDVSYDYYPVNGNSYQELVLSVNGNGPVDHADGRRYAGQTKWTTGWTYKYEASAKIDRDYLTVSVNIFDFQFKADISILLPMQAENQALDYHDAALWEKFLQGLIEHEHDHVRIVNDPKYVDEALKRISSIKSLTLYYQQDMNIEAAIKDAVESETLKIGHDLIKQIKKRNDDYDRVTEHGLRPEMRQAFWGMN